MQRKVRIFLNAILSVILIGSVLFSLGCAKKGPKEYKIGVVGPFTGEGATYGAAMKKGIDLAIEEINANGGVNKTKLAAVYRDSKLDAKEGISSFRYLATAEKVPIVLGDAASSVSLAIAPVANESKVVLFSSISTADALKDAGDYFFRNVPPNSNQAKTAAYFIKDYLKKNNVALLYVNKDYGVNMDKVFTEFFSNIGGTVISHNSYEPDQNDFRSVLSKVKEGNPDIIYIPGEYQGNALILRQARTMGIDATFISGDGAYSPKLIQIAGDAAEGFYCTLMSMPKSDQSPEVAKFFKMYKEKYNEDVDVYSAYSYDAVNMVAQAIKDGGYTGEGIKNALYNITYNGITGTTKFDKNGEVDKPYSIYVVKGGKFTLLPWVPKF